jgi:hypothetical protein
LEGTGLRSMKVPGAVHVSLRCALFVA